MNDQIDNVKLYKYNLTATQVKTAYNEGAHPLKISGNLLYEELTYMIRKAIFNVYNILGSGHKEQVYQKALIQEFEELNIPLIHYLKTTGFQLGLLVNFGASKLYIKRLVWTDPRKSVINQRESIT